MKPGQRLIEGLDARIALNDAGNDKLSLGDVGSAFCILHTKMPTFCRKGCLSVLYPT